jgi:transcription initiation factor IIE alpha subunit
MSDRQSEKPARTGFWKISMDYIDDAEQEIEEELDEWDEEEESEAMEDTSFVCEDCDYRWEELTAEEIDTGTIVCPMCGSVNVTQL